MTFALLLGMAQCKKESTIPNGDNNEGVRITLKVDDGPSTGSGTDDGEKLNVYPATGAVIFTQGDEIYVGNNGKYVGTLTFENGLFQGTVSGDLSTNDYLHFYFVGNKPTSPSTLAAGITSYTVDISDQSAGLPAISYAPSTAKYSSSTTAYTAKLLNKSALVKFVPSMATTQPITVSGLNNEVQIDFANHTLAPTGTTGGITLFSAGDAEKWAILLEQASLSGLTVSVDGYNATIDGTTLPSAITNNMYYNTGIGVSMTAAYQTFVVNSSSSDPSVVSFNNAASIPTPKLYFETNYGDGLTLTRANGIVDFNGHSANELFIQNDEEGESITLQNGTIGDKPIDGAGGTNRYFKGTVIMENMTVNGLIYTDGHAFIINSGTYNQKICCDTYSGYPGTTTIYGGYFKELGFNSGPQGTFILYGGKYQTRPDNAWCAEGYTIKSNTDFDSGTYPWVVSALPEGALRGEFTINDNGDKVYFSKGNLQYHGTDHDWRFAEHQYDYVGAWNTSNWVDLFGWGTWGEGKNPLQTEGSFTWSSDFSGTIIDVSSTGWCTLTGDEWAYVFNTRTNAASKKGHGNVNGVNGMILLPDDWTLPGGLTFTSGNSEWTNVYTSSQWVQMEANGAVFLPAAGYRNATSLNVVGNNGYYWSSTYHNSDNAYFAHFHSNSHDSKVYNSRYYGYAVRLVRDVE